MVEARTGHVSVWIGRFGSQAALEAHIDGTYDEDGEYTEAPFERDFGIDVDPDFREAVYVGPLVPEAVPSVIRRGFSGIEQFRAALERDLAALPAAAVATYDSLFFLYDYEGVPRTMYSERMLMIGSYTHPFQGLRVVPSLGG